MDPTAKAISGARSEMSPDEMEELAEQICTYHAPDGTQQAQIGEVRQATRNLIVTILKHLPTISRPHRSLAQGARNHDDSEREHCAEGAIYFIMAGKVSVGSVPFGTEKWPRSRAQERGH